MHNTGLIWVSANSAGLPGASQKVGIVCCKDSSRRKDYPKVSFTRDGKFRTSFDKVIVKIRKYCGFHSEGHTESKTSLCGNLRSTRARWHPSSSCDRITTGSRR